MGVPSAPKAPKQPALPPPKPMPVDETNAEVQSSKREMQKNELRKMGRGGSILSGSLVSDASGTGAKKSLLGG